MLPPAPPRLSMMICWPSASEIFGLSMRDSTSAPPPGGKPTIQRIGFDGQVWADAVAAVATSVAARTDFRIFIDLPSDIALGLPPPQPSPARARGGGSRTRSFFPPLRMQRAGEGYGGGTADASDF